MLTEYLPPRTTDVLSIARMPAARQSSLVGELLSRARDAIWDDPDKALRFLIELENVLEPTQARHAPDEALLLPLVLHPSTPGAAPPRGGLATWQLRRILAHLEAHFAQAPSVDDLAGLIDMSKGHFSRAVKLSTGETPHNLLIRARLRMAQRLMLTTNDPLSEIACTCGFTDQAHMTRLFKRFLHHTPAVWRRLQGQI